MEMLLEDMHFTIRHAILHTILCQETQFRMKSMKSYCYFIAGYLQMWDNWCDNEKLLHFIFSTRRCPWVFIVYEVQNSTIISSACIVDSRPRNLLYSYCSFNCASEAVNNITKGKFKVIEMHTCYSLFDTKKVSGIADCWDRQQVIDCNNLWYQSFEWGDFLNTKCALHVNSSFVKHQRKSTHSKFGWLAESRQCNWFIICLYFMADNLFQLAVDTCKRKTLFQSKPPSMNCVMKHIFAKYLK